MFSFFKKNKVVTTTKGSHGRHWYTVFHEDFENEEVMKYICDSFQTGKYRHAGKAVVVDDPLTRVVIVGETMLTAFPHWKGSKYEKFTVSKIIQWSHSENLEAIVQVEHQSGCGVSFFATDYVFNKVKYQKEKNLQINIVGLVYKLEEFDAQEANKSVQEISFSEDFCGYVPTEFPDEVNFIGKIRTVHEHFLGTIPGFILTISFTPDFTIDVFIAKTNCEIDIKAENHVAGWAWLIGTLE